MSKRDERDAQMYEKGWQAGQASNPVTRRLAKLERVAEAARKRMEGWTRETYLELAEALADLESGA